MMAESLKTWCMISGPFILEHCVPRRDECKRMNEPTMEYMRFNKEDSLKKRYLFKLGTNLIGMVIGIITQAIIPRGLGPKAFGDFSFLRDFFTQFVGFFDMGTSIGFYTKLSQRQKDIGIITL